MLTRLRPELKRKLKGGRLFPWVEHWRLWLRDQEYRSRDREERAKFRQFRDRDGGIGLGVDLLPQGIEPKTALIVSQSYLPFARLEAMMLKAFHMAGFETVVLGNRRYEFLRYGWLAGNKRVLESYDYSTTGEPEWVGEQVENLRTLQDWLALEYQGVHVGRFVIAKTLRRLLTGKLDFADPRIQTTLREALRYSVHQAQTAAAALEEIRPDCVLLMDRGYSGYGEFFDAALNRGIDMITWHLGYKSNRIVVKRYHLGNERDHPFSPSAESWQRIRAIPWLPEYGHQIRQELFEAYQTQDWFSVVGTQFDKQILSKEKTRRKLDLAPDRKVAVIFPHILWDGSFFYGEDLFEDYTEWFAETLRAAAANDRVQWVVKLHPAHVVKAKQNRDPEKAAEMGVIERIFGEVPDHVKLVPPDTDLSTYCLFEIADYTVTVRGTVGIESALFGIPVVTGGTGRYDRRGFTLDSSTREEYLAKLATLETYPRLSQEQLELAERYAYGTFLCKPLALSSVSLEYERDAVATPRVTVHCRTREQWLAGDDMRELSEFLADGKREDMLVLPQEAPGAS